MTAIERTAYPRFTRAPSVKELREIYTPTPTDAAFVSTHARGPAQKLALMILLKIYQRLDYFPDPQTIPVAVISHIRAVMKYPPDLVPDMHPPRSTAIMPRSGSIWRCSMRANTSDMSQRALCIRLPRSWIVRRI